MSKVTMTIEVDRKLALKLLTLKEKVENGGNMVVVDDTVRGEIMFLIGHWMVIQGDGEEAVATSSPGARENEPLPTAVTKHLFLDLVLKQGGDLYSELIDAAHKLGLWPLFHECCSFLACQIKLVPAALKDLKLDSEGCKLTAPCIKSFLSYLPLEQRLECVTVGLTEWQEASVRLWSEQNVLIFRKQGVELPTTMVNPCTHIDQSDLNYRNLVEYTEQDLKDNLESIRTTSRRKLPGRFLDITRKCHNLKVLLWDQEFGQMAEPKLARVLEVSCTKLEHLQGTITKTFKFEATAICPASFLDIYEPAQQMVCYNVTFDTDDEMARKRKFDGDKVAGQVKMQSNSNIEDNSSKLKPKLNEWIRTEETEQKFKNDIRAILGSKGSKGSKCVCLDKVWYDELQYYIGSSEVDRPRPGPINKTRITKPLKPHMVARAGLVMDVDYVVVSEDCFTNLSKIFRVPLLFYY